MGLIVSAAVKWPQIEPSAVEKRFFLITHRFWERSHLSTDAVGMYDLVRVIIFFLTFTGVRFVSRIIRHERFFFQCRNFFLQVFPS